jgi:hypothetical protein
MMFLLANHPEKIRLGEITAAVDANNKSFRTTTDAFLRWVLYMTGAADMHMATASGETMMCRAVGFLSLSTMWCALKWMNKCLVGRTELDGLVVKNSVDVFKNAH